MNITCNMLNKKNGFTLKCVVFWIMSLFYLLYKFSCVKKICDYVLVSVLGTCEEKKISLLKLRLSVTPLF